MASFDISSLYTNIPVLETIDILCNEIFTNEPIFYGFDKKGFSDFLKLAITNTHFIFNNTLYKQVDGLAMGNPLAPSLANIFLCHLETMLFEKCPMNFKPIFYRRYLDDTFVVFAERSPHCDDFLNFINDLHPNINFTIEKEIDSKLPFLDVCIKRLDRSFTTSIFRKPTFTGLGLSYFSFAPYIHKLNSIRTLLHRAYHLSSDYFSFSTELQFLKTFFYQ
jgi:hypothetical protein